MRKLERVVIIVKIEGEIPTGCQYEWEGSRNITAINSKEPNGLPVGARRTQSTMSVTDKTHK